MSGVLGWGKAACGQLGLKGEEVDRVTIPTQIPNLRGSEVADLCCGDNHTLVCLKDGSLYSCGCNDDSQLGHTKSTKRFEHVDALKATLVRKVCCGSQHSMALTGAHEVFTWGSNDQGQLGRNKVTDELRRIPKLVTSLAVYSITQIACGSHHCIALTNEGLIASWGANSCGQLGLGTTAGVRDKPEMLTCLNGIPVAQVAAGGNQSFTLSMSGAIHCWGKNNHGQLGLGDQKDRNAPALCRSLRSQKIKYLACGEDHTAALTLDGRVFTFGAGSYGQLGHGNNDDCIVPRQIMELSGNEMTQIACGRCHTLVHEAKSGRLYSFGLGGCGQLGLNSFDTKNLPCKVHGPFVAARSKGSSLPMTVDDEGSPLVVERIFTGGDHCFVIYKPDDMGANVKDYRIPSPSSQILTLSSERMAALEKLKIADVPPEELSYEIEKIFSNSACLNGSFLLKNNEHCGSSSKNHGLDMAQVRHTFDRLCKAANVMMEQKICRSIETMLRSSLSPCDIEAMRVYLILPECHLFNEPKRFTSLLTPFGQSIISLDKPAAKFLSQWWGKLQPSFFSRLVKIYKQCVEFLLNVSSSCSDMEASNRSRALYISLEVLKKLNTVNEDNKQVIPYHSFYIPTLKDVINISDDYTKWFVEEHLGRGSVRQELRYCVYPFLFDGGAKTILLTTDATLQMRIAMDESNRRNMMSLITNIEPVSSYLVIAVNRANIVKETINTLEKCSQHDLKKPLKVIFVGEDAVDEGGVRKEFFMLMLREVLDPKYGMFLLNSDSHLMWFNSQTFEESAMFHLIGNVCGLAIYNSTIIDLPFPLALYKKLLCRHILLDDLRELMPTVGRSLQELLDYEGEDVEDVFCLYFVVNQEWFGEVKVVELCKDGANKSVTHENKEEYVELYVNFLLNYSVDAQFRAFCEGFLKVCGGRALDLFHPRELQAMVIGNEDYDFEVLEKNTQYKGEYYRNHETIKFFWEVFHSFSLENKKKFLLFLTGSDRIPVLGMSQIKMIIQSTRGGEEFLPVAHTCFNLLDLPVYKSRDVLHAKLLLAIQHSEGFGIV